MTKPIARIGDKTYGYCKKHKKDFKGTIISGSPNVLVEGSPAARIGDIVKSDCGHVGKIITGCPVVDVNSPPVARLGDKTDGIYQATIVSACKKTFVA